MVDQALNYAIQSGSGIVWVVFILVLAAFFFIIRWIFDTNNEREMRLIEVIDGSIKEASKQQEANRQAIEKNTAAINKQNTILNLIQGWVQPRRRAQNGQSDPGH